MDADGSGALQWDELREGRHVSTIVGLVFSILIAILIFNHLFIQLQDLYPFGLVIKWTASRSRVLIARLSKELCKLCDPEDQGKELAICAKVW